MLYLVQNNLPKTLKRLLVFEDFDEDIAAALCNALWPPVDVSRIVDAMVGTAFASRSLDLEQISVAYMVNAEDFFQACVPTWIWQRLQSLALNRNSCGIRKTARRLRLCFVKLALLRSGCPDYIL
jgi:hypothetical protein